MSELIYNIIAWDQHWTVFFNNQGTPFWDTFIWLYTDKLTWIPLALMLLICIVRKQWKVALLTVAAIVVLVFMCDWITSSVIKPYFHRYRPTRDPIVGELVRTIHEYRGGRFGFCSSHSSNSFGLFFFTSWLFRKRSYTVAMLIWAVMMSYSRIYCGVHYIMDILVGAIWGLLSAGVCYQGYVYLYRRYGLEKYSSALKTCKVRTNEIPCDYTSKEVNAIVGVMCATVIVLFAITLIAAG